MFSTVDKAIVALIGAVIFLVNNFTGLTVNLSPETINAIVSVAMPLLVWAVPNKAA